MTTLIYVPRLIESAEQAEATPEDAVFLLDGTGVASKGRFDPDNGACRVWIAGGDGYHTTETILAEYQVTYLVPIEADEEVLTEDTYASSEQLRRFTTPWQRFTSPKETP